MIKPKDAAWCTAVAVIIPFIFRVLRAKTYESLTEVTASGLLVLIVFPLVAFGIVTVSNKISNR